MFCTNCGVALEESVVYCSHCGTATGRPGTASTPRPAMQLTRSRYDSRIAGVCGGLAQYLVADSTLVRVIWLIATICFPPLLLGYIAAWIVMPREAPRLAFLGESSMAQPQS